jgi:hypothetical protein
MRLLTVISIIFEGFGGSKAGLLMPNIRRNNASTRSHLLVPKFQFHLQKNVMTAGCIIHKIVVIEFCARVELRSPRCSRGRRITSVEEWFDDSAKRASNIRL